MYATHVHFNEKCFICDAKEPGKSTKVKYAAINRHQTHCLSLFVLL